MFVLVTKTQKQPHSRLEFLLEFLVSLVEFPQFPPLHPQRSLDVELPR
jgi:hypothetical protein